MLVRTMKYHLRLFLNPRPNTASRRLVLDSRYIAILVVFFKQHGIQKHIRPTKNYHALGWYLGQIYIAKMQRKPFRREPRTRNKS